MPEPLKVKKSTTEDSNDELRQKAKRWDERKTVYRQNEDGTRSTHRMESGETDGKYYAHPTIFPKDPKNTKSHDPKDWLDLGDNPNAAFDTARARGELYIFKKDENARKWAEGEYKKN